MLTRRISNPRRRPTNRRLARHINNAAILLCLHEWQDSADHACWNGQVCGEDAIPFKVCDLVGGFVSVHYSGDVCEDVDFITVLGLEV